LARRKRTAQEPGRPAFFLGKERQHGEPDKNLRRATRLRTHELPAERQRTSVRIEVGEWQGETGAILDHTGQTDEAIIHLRKVVEGKPDAADARRNLGHALADKGDLQAASVQLEEALRLSGGRDPLTLHLLGRVYADLGRFPEAVRAQREETGYLCWRRRVRDKPNAPRSATMAPIGARSAGAPIEQEQPDELAAGSVLVPPLPLAPPPTVVDLPP